MDRPDYTAGYALGLGTTPFPPPPAPTLPLDVLIGLKLVLWTLVAEIAFGLFGDGFGRLTALLLGSTTSGAAAYADATQLVIGKLGALAVLFDRIRALTPTALRDRSHAGCAWFGDTDERVALAFLAGGVMASARTLMLVPEPTAVESATVASPGILPAMLYAFATIALAPVVEELLFRGALFGALRTHLGTLSAATVVTVAFALAHHAQIMMYPPSVIGTLALGAAAMALRVRTGSLATAIALHSGHNFVTCMALAVL